MDHPRLHNHDKVLLEALASSKELNINQWSIACAHAVFDSFLSFSCGVLFELRLRNIMFNAKLTSAALGLVVLLLLNCFAFEAVNAQCSLSAFSSCIKTVQGAYPPNPDVACCTAVKAANPSCLCNQLQNNNYPQGWVKNALAMPRVCGRTQLSGYRCGSTCFALLWKHINVHYQGWIVCAFLVLFWCLIVILPVTPMKLVSYLLFQWHFLLGVGP